MIIDPKIGIFTLCKKKIVGENWIWKKAIIIIHVARLLLFIFPSHANEENESWENYKNK